MYPPCGDAGRFRELERLNKKLADELCECKNAWWLLHDRAENEENRLMEIITVLKKEVKTRDAETLIAEPAATHEFESVELRLRGGAARRHVAPSRCRHGPLARPRHGCHAEA